MPRCGALPLRPCSGWGLPSRRSHLRRWWSLTPPFHPYRQCQARSRPAGGGLFSVALSRGSPRVGVTDHPALRSPDLPRRSRKTGTDATARPARSSPPKSSPAAVGSLSAIAQNMRSMRRIRSIREPLITQSEKGGAGNPQVQRPSRPATSAGADRRTQGFFRWQADPRAGPSAARAPEAARQDFPAEQADSATKSAYRRDDSNGGPSMLLPGPQPGTTLELRCCSRSIRVPTMR